MHSKTRSASALCPLQGTADDNTSFPATISDVTLPRELVEWILLLLDTESVLTCRLVNREFNDIVQSSTLLQYSLACKAAGVIDNPQSPLSYSERLEALKKQEAAWRKLKPVFEMTIDGINQTSSICFSTEGVYFLGDDNMRDMKYCHLTSFPQDNPRWIRIPGHGPVLNWSGTLVNFAAALHEHDLVINLISSETENQGYRQRHSLDLVLLKFSTGEYHPLARRPRIHVQRSSEARPWVVPRIVGDNLALVVHCRDGTFSDKLIIIDWKTGHKRLQHEGTKNAYHTLDFISPEILLVPNLILSHVEIWHLPPSHPNDIPPVQILSLQIPAVSPEYSLFNFGCRAEPKLFLQSTPHCPQRPFFPSPEDSIVVLSLRMLSNSPFTSQLRASYSLIMHRRALLDKIQKWTSPSFIEQQGDITGRLTNELIVHKIVDPEDGSVKLDAQSKLVSMMSDPSSSRSRDSPTFATSQASQTSQTSHISTNSSTSRCTFLQVPWAKWGPPISRWLQVNETQAQWFGYSNGQRYAFSERNPLDRRKLMVSVADFNPHNFRRNAERTGGCEDNGSSGDKQKEFEILDHKGVFSEEVYMGLKCVVHRVPDEYDFDLMLMDEERLFGVKLNRLGWRESVKVFYIG
ncbi:hypothetical protein M378DRAFT_170914 [Amanita muscaria Koide BX008]|uniref:F-box domain-containing protein n=1 Tax=Amanita muscaria (strain Koide BX008) TaxID=946122 RepID=A0A0C2WPK7_AMAMK|nr:hypothetical protein M378DRAFT_170914 [Amanita muscaria Koide BX008]